VITSTLSFKLVCFSCWKIGLHSSSLFIMRALIAYSALVLGLATLAHGFGTGAPNAPHICNSLTPKHGGEEQKTPSPYGLAVSKKTVRRGETVTFTVISSGGEKIRGFLVQARDSSGNAAPVGTFIAGPGSQGIACSDIPDSSLTHSNNDERSSVSVQWKAPNQPGTYNILATIVQDKLTYWVAQKSDTITVN